MAQDLGYETCLLVYNPIELTFDRPVIRLKRVRCPMYSVLVDWSITLLPYGPLSSALYIKKVCILQ